LWEKTVTYSAEIRLRRDNPEQLAADFQAVAQLLEERKAAFVAAGPRADPPPQSRGLRLVPG